MSSAGAPATEVAPPRRQQIIESAAELFARSGFRGVSIYDIGAAVGISGPALYKHFASKDALLAEMLIGISERLLAEGHARAGAAANGGVAGSADGPAVGVLEALVGWHVEFALGNPALITVQFRDLESLGEDDQRTVRRLQREYVELWVQTIMDVTGSDAAHARSAAHAVFGLINSTPHSARLSRADMEQQLRRMSMAALSVAAS